MDRKTGFLVAGCLAVVSVAVWRLVADAPVAPTRPLQLPVPPNATSPIASNTAETPSRAAAVASGHNTATVKTSNKPEPRRAARVEPRIERAAAPAPSVTPSDAPAGVTPAAPVLTYERRVADAAALGTDDVEGAARRLEQLTADEPDRPEAYEALAAIRLRQGDYSQAGEMFESALRHGGKATFTIMHDHTRGNFESTPDATCVGELTVLSNSIAFEGADGHRFAAGWGDVRDAGSNRFFGSGIGGFHVAINVEGKYKNFNLAPRSREKAEGKFILELLAANSRRADRGK